MDTQILPDRSHIYQGLYNQIQAVIADEPSYIARYASAAAILFEAFEEFHWVGFYRLDLHKTDELVIGPYQGTSACLRIAFGRGVCGTAAARKQTLRIDDVDAFAGHIACDSRSKSEIVVPVCNEDGRLVAVLDVDSHKYAAFNLQDEQGLEAICADLVYGAFYD